jgi:crotonobetainyl-CoA:carnitine CoA-transferase CaiB-like acyl-CoA transferase
MEQEPELPLAGIRIADFSWVLAGPHCTKWLGAMGAEVIKIESHFRPDRFRNVAPFIGGVEAMDSSVAFNMLNYSKKDCTINLGTSEGRRLAQEVVRQSHVVIENFSAGVAERLGLGYAELSRDHPDLVMVSSSGVGRTGADAGMRAFGKSIHSFAGQTYLTRYPHTAPRGIGGTWTDPVTGTTACLAILAGLESAERTGEGVHYDLSMTESTIALLVEPYLDILATGEEPEPMGNSHPTAAIHDTFKSADNQWVAVAAHDDTEMRSLRQLLGCSQDATCEAVEQELRRWISGASRADALEALEAAGVCATPVLRFDELPASAQYLDRNLAVELDNRGIGAYKALKLPWQQYPAPNYVYTSAPKLGEHNAYVFEKILGLTGARLDELSGSEVLM